MATAAVKAPAAAPAAAPRKKGSLLLIIVLVVTLLAAGGVGAWWFLAQSNGNDEDEEVPSRPAIFLPLEQFTVNLQPEDGQQFLQTAMTLKVTEEDVAEGIKAQMPEVRSRLLFLLSSKKPSEVNSVEGKNKLVEDIIREVEASLPPVKSAKKSKKKARDDEEGKASGKGKKAKAKEPAEEEEEEPTPGRVLAVYFTHFIVQ